MPVNDELGMRMKHNYEEVSKTRLTRRMPVAIRIDAKAFHTFTRGFQKPFDKVVMNAMQKTMKYLCENIQGCVFGYTQSDEITLLLVDYKKFDSSAWFDYEVQKLCSISASMATMAFNKFFADILFSINTFLNFDDDESHIDALKENGFNVDLLYGKNRNSEYYDKVTNLIDIYSEAQRKGAMFDARCFNIPKEEVCNLIYWRQLDATRNSIQMVGQANFSHKELQNKSCNDIQDMLMVQKGINWNNFPVDCKRGAACIRISKEVNIAGTMDTISPWEIDKNMPILKGEDRKYVDKWIYIGEWFELKNCANEGVYCSVCSKKVYKLDYANQKIKSKYCPNCGARMNV